MNAEAKLKTEMVVATKFDLFKWFIAIVLVAVSVVGNHYFSAEPLLYRVFGVLAISFLAIVVVLRTAKGKIFIQLAKDARNEIRKVVWPTKQETMQTTMIVVVVVLVMALLLWGMDSLLGWLISFIVG